MHRADSKEQLVLLLYSILVGVCISVLYDIFVLLRKLFPKTPPALVFIEDIVFCLLSGFWYFVFIFCANLGVPRMYSLAGGLFGFVMWRKTFSKVLLVILEKTIRFVLRIMGKILKIIRRPIVFILSIMTKICTSILCKIMIYIKSVKYLFIFSKRRYIMYTCIKKGKCFDFEKKEEYVKL